MIPIKADFNGGDLGQGHDLLGGQEAHLVQEDQRAEVLAGIQDMADPLDRVAIQDQAIAVQAHALMGVLEGHPLDLALVILRMDRTVEVPNKNYFFLFCDLFQPGFNTPLLATTWLYHLISKAYPSALLRLGF